MSFAKGWVPQAADTRDKQYTPSSVDMPSSFSLRTSPHNGPVLNQGQLGTCVPNSNADAYRFLLSKEGHPVFLPSRLYIYAEGRQMEGTPLTEDSGMVVRDALKVLAAGVPPEVDDPYSDANPGPFQNAPTAAQRAEATFHAIDYLSINPKGPGMPLRSCLLEGYPFTFGFSVPSLLESDSMASGEEIFLPLPGRGNELTGEGHGVQCVGFDFSCSRFPQPAFEIKNQWAPSWCDEGYFWMDYRYFGPLATDLWTLRSSN